MNGLLIFSGLLAVALGGRLPIDEGHPYIVGGKETDIKEIPYQVSLHVGYLFHCAGCIISPTHIITTAHCVMTKYKYKIRAGSSQEESGGIVVPVKNVTIHHKFNLNTVDYDVGIVELATPLNFSETIQPIKIVDKEPEDGEQVLISGWGSIKEEGFPVKNLHSALIPMVNRKTCEANYKNYAEITPRKICAGAEGKGSCFGDSGGPLAYKGVLAGLVSHGVGCGRKDFPGVYANLADPEVRKFIKEHANV